MNHLECVTVRILADRELCSGCLMWSDDGKSLYCLTARHNLYIERIDVTTGKNMLQFASEITITSDCGCKQYSIINYFQEGGGDKEPTEGLDLTIFEIEQNEYTKDVPGTITAGYFSKEYDYKISGYPKIMNGDRAAINAEFNEEKGNGGLLFNLQNQNSTPFTKYNDILGISGSGCFQEVHRMYKFVGIENSTPNSLVPYNLVHCIPSTAINKLLSDNNLPLLPLPTPSYIDNKFGNYLTHNEVLGKAVYVNDWVKISSSDEIEKEINNLFSDENKDTNTLCLCGQSGIGKTRGVLEASKKFKHVIYYENYDTFRKESNIIMREFDEKGEPFKIIVDEVGYDKPQSVNSDFFSYPEIKIALIITVPKQKYPYNSMFVEIKACDDDVKKIVKKKFESSTYITADLAAVIADSIFSLCYNDLRLALLFSEIVERDPNKDIMRIQPSQMFSDFRTAEAILKKP